MKQAWHLAASDGALSASHTMSLKTEPMSPTAHPD
jgi:hypothetical protein